MIKLNPALIKATRTKLGMEVKAAAADLGINPTAFFLWESGMRNPSPRGLALLESWLVRHAAAGIEYIDAPAKPAKTKPAKGPVVKKLSPKKTMHQASVERATAAVAERNAKLAAQQDAVKAAIHAANPGLADSAIATVKIVDAVDAKIAAVEAGKAVAAGKASSLKSKPVASPSVLGTTIDLSDAEIGLSPLPIAVKSAKPKAAKLKTAKAAMATVAKKAKAGA